MECIETLYEQYYNLIERFQESGSNDYSTNLLDYGIALEYYDQVDKAVEDMKIFYEKCLKRSYIEDAINEQFECNRAENVKFGLLIDIIRCYDGLDHPTSFTTPEGIALMILLGKVLGVGEIQSYEQLKSVDSATLSIIDIIP